MITIPIWKDIFLAVALHLNVHIYLNFLLSCFNMEGFSFHVFTHRQKGRFVITLVPEHWAGQVPACCLPSLTSVWHFIGKRRSRHSAGVAARPLGGASLCGASLRLTARLASAPCQLQESSLARFWSLGSAEFLFCFPGSLSCDYRRIFMNYQMHLVVYLLLRKQYGVTAFVSAIQVRLIKYELRSL